MNSRYQRIDHIEKKSLECGIVGNEDVISDNSFFIGILVRNDGLNYLLISVIYLFSPHLSLT